MMPADYDDLVRAIHADTESAIARIARHIIETCDYCGCALHRAGIAIAGGSAVIMATCPVCDRRDTTEDD